MAVEHATDDARTDTLIKQRDGRSCRNELSNRWLQFLHQSGLVRCESPELEGVLDESTSHRNVARLTSLMILMSIQLLEDVVNKWNN